MTALASPSLIHDAAAQSLITFDPSQRRFFDDDSRVQLVIWHRQKGKDFTAAAKAVDRGMKTGRNWYITSLTQRQADETGKKAEKIFTAFKTLLKIRAKATLDEFQYEDYDQEINQTFVRTARKLILPNKAEIVSLPGKNPDTLAGFTGNIVLTEFGLFPKGGYEHWRVLFPIATRNAAQIIAITTPRSKKTKAYELFCDPENYSIHFCDIQKSVREDGYQLTDNKGLPCDIETFKKLYGDPSGWEREYECKWTGDMDALITWAQILAAQETLLLPRILAVQDDQGWNNQFFDCSQLPPGRLEMGWDVARSGDLAPLWVNLARPDGKKELRFLVVMHKCRFELQRHIIKTAMHCRPGNVGCGDATSIGSDSNETLKAWFGERWEGVVFSTKSKSDLGSIGRTAYGDGTQRLPVITEDGHRLKFIATDLYSIQCQPIGDSADKRLQLTETENELEPRSHCDIAYSNLLALKAGALQGGKHAPRQRVSAEEVPLGW